MSSAAANPIAIFLDVWTREFATSVEMFTGQAVKAESTSGVIPTGSAQTGDVLWHAQTLRGRGEARVWLGVPSTACAALTNGAAEDAAAATQLLHEMFDQSMKAAAQVLNTGACPGLQCADTFTTDVPAADAPSVDAGWFRAGDATVIPVFIRYERTLESMLGSRGAGVADLPPAIAAAPSTSEMPPVFERFVGVELPVSVVLGRATLRVRDVLKLTVGSLVELDRRPSDPVDVCVHDVVVARGEVVSIRGNYGVRVVEVMSQRDRFELQGRGRSLGRLSAAGEPAARPSVH